GGRQWRERAGQALAVGLVAGRAVGLVGLLAGGGIGGCSLAEGLVGPAGEQGGNETERERLAFHRRAPGAACGQTSSILILGPDPPPLLDLDQPDARMHRVIAQAEPPAWRMRVIPPASRSGVLRGQPRRPAAVVLAACR